MKKMVNEDIITALRNAVNSGESLETAVNTLITSGYDSKEVYEASQFVSGLLPGLSQQAFQQSALQTPQKTFQPSPLQPTIYESPQFPQQPLQGYQQPRPQPLQQQLLQQPQQLSTQSQKKSYFKEIILVIILLVLLGILAGIIFFKDKILGFFSG